MRDSRALHPDVRTLYGVNLRPPPGTRFDAGVATTYSLDFETALAVPVTLALYASESREELLASPYALLEGLERNADRLAIFCEAGGIHAHPAAQSRLCALLERTVIQAMAPNGGAFHPKVWLLRYRSELESERPRMRLLILSRNLTKDRSWDLALCLDGTVVRGLRPDNKPLTEFLLQLPAFATGPLPPHARPLVESLAEDLSRTEWSLPDPYDDVSFAVNGIGRRRWKPERCNRLAVISPFCDADALGMLADLVDRDEPWLVSRPEELAAIDPSVLERFSQVSVMDEMAESEDGEGNDHEEGTIAPLSGLHAKAVLQEIGWRTAITMGSANATRPALITDRNVEVLATLSGQRARVGSIAEILGEDGLGRVLRPFLPTEIDAVDAERRLAEQQVDEARRALAGAALRLVCGRDAANEEEGLWSVTLEPGQPLALAQIGAVTLWPITRGESHARSALEPLRQGGAVELGAMPLLDITRFIAIRIVDESGKAEALFTLGLEVQGLPEDRHRAILRWVINSREAFLRYLRLLLIDAEDPFAAQAALDQANGSEAWQVGSGDEPFLELMVRSLAQGGHRLRDVHRLMARLSRSGEGEPDGVVPEDFLALWGAFKAVLDEKEHWRAAE